MKSRAGEIIVVKDRPVNAKSGIVVARSRCTGCGIEEYRGDKTEVDCEVCEIARRFLCEMVHNRTLADLETKAEDLWRVAVKLSIASRSKWEDAGS